jgi:hypothetical protein
MSKLQLVERRLGRRRAAASVKHFFDDVVEDVEHESIVSSLPDGTEQVATTRLLEADLKVYIRLKVVYDNHSPNKSLSATFLS